MDVTNPNEQPVSRPNPTPATHPTIEIVRRGRTSVDESTERIRPETTPLREPLERRKYYVPVKGKFFISTTLATIWLCASWLLAQNWLNDLAQVTGYAPAVLIIFFIALLPGFLNVHIIASVVMDHPPKLRLDLCF